MLGIREQIRAPEPWYGPVRAWAYLASDVAALVVSVAGRWFTGWQVFCALGIVICVIDLGKRHKGKRRRASKAIGDKARALRSALVRTMRERTRPVLRPGPAPA